MTSARMFHRRGHGGCAAALVAVATLLGLAQGATTALAAPYARAAAGGHAAATGGTISTVAGGVGGPGPATGIGLVSVNAPEIACGTPPSDADVTVAAGHLYIADASVRQVDTRTDMLTTPAGTGAAGPFGAGGPAVRASIVACGVAVDHARNLVIADPLRRRVEVVPPKSGTFYGRRMTAGHLYVVAGNGGTGPGVSGVPATSAPLNRPVDVVVDGAGNLVIADVGTIGGKLGGLVRVVAASTGTFYGEAMTAGDIYTVAGNGKSGFSGDGGPATAAELNFPGAVTLDAAGNLVIADAFNERVRVVAEHTGTFYGQAMTAGDIYTVAGDGTEGFGGDGGPATQAAMDTPAGVALDHAGNLLISDSIDRRVRAVAASDGTFYGVPMTKGDIYTIAGGGTARRDFGDGGPATQAVLGGPAGLAVDPAGNVLIADGTARVRLVADTTGTFYGQKMTKNDIYSVAGHSAADFCCDGAPATTAEMNGPAAVITDAAGNVVIADETDNRIRVVAASTGTFYGQQMTAGDIYTVAGDGQHGVSPDGTPATQAALSGPASVRADRHGNLLITDARRNVVQMVAAVSGTFFGVPMTAGDIYTVAGNGLPQFSGDGGPALSAGITHPSALAVDGAGNLLIAEPDDSRIRVVAASTGTFYGRKMTADDIYTIAGNGTTGFAGDGGPATQAELGGANGVMPDRAGNLVIADTVNARVRVVAEHTGTFYGQQMTQGDIYTVAGNGTPGFAGDGGPAASAEFDLPMAVAVDGTGNLVIADTGDGGPGEAGNERVRVVAEHTGTFYGQQMTQGDIYTVAGNGTPGFAGDGGAATSAELDVPLGVGLDSAGDLLVAEVNDGRVREISR